MKLNHHLIHGDYESSISPPDYDQIPVGSLIKCIIGQFAKTHDNRHIPVTQNDILIFVKYIDQYHAEVLYRNMIVIVQHHSKSLFYFKIIS